MRMKKYVQLIVGAFVALFYAPLLPMLSAQSYDDLWKQLQEAERKSLPQTVIKLADQIYEKALKEKNIDLYAIYGNHDSKMEDHFYEDMGVILLRDNWREINIDGTKFALCGLYDSGRENRTAVRYIFPSRWNINFSATIRSHSKKTFSAVLLPSAD